MRLGVLCTHCHVQSYVPPGAVIAHCNPERTEGVYCYRCPRIDCRQPVRKAATATALGLLEHGGVVMHVRAGGAPIGDGDLQAFLAALDGLEEAVAVLADAEGPDDVVR